MCKKGISHQVAIKVTLVMRTVTKLDMIFSLIN